MSYRKTLCLKNSSLSYPHKKASKILPLGSDIIVILINK